MKLGDLISMITIDNIQQIVGTDFGMKEVRLWQVKEREINGMHEYVIDINEGIYIHRVIVDREPRETNFFRIYKGYKNNPTIHWLNRNQLQDKDEFLRVVRRVMLE